MRRRVALLTTGLLAGATLAVTGAAPAHACHDMVIAEDPVVNYVCSVHPDPGPWVQHYYNVVFDTAHWAYCTVSPRC